MQANAASTGVAPDQPLIGIAIGCRVCQEADLRAAIGCAADPTTASAPSMETVSFVDGER